MAMEVYRPTSPAEKRDSATPTATTTAQPDRPVTHQLTIPLGRKPPATPRSQSAAERSGLAASAGGVDDAVARCEAQVGKRARASCLDRLAREPKRP